MQATRKSSRATWALVAVGLVVVAGIVALLLRRPAETLTAARLQTAEQRWHASGVSDYEMRIVVSGIQQGTHHIRVRGGRVVEMTTGGAEVPKHVWQRWTVEGLFAFLEEELENAKDPENAYGVEDPSQVILQVTLDKELGYPRHFLRHVMGRQASIEWDVEEFERIDE